MPNLRKRFEITVTETLNKNLGTLMLKHNDYYFCYQEDQEP